MVCTAIMGHGVVGSGVAEILIERKHLISEKIKDDICVKYILDLRDFPLVPYSQKFIKNFNIILNDPEVKIVVEVMGGVNPAYEFTKKCLLSGKSVVSSNKELVAAKGDELLKIAEENNVNYLFEASVGGGIPILRPMAQCLAANKITKIAGILNGTTNFILDKMIVDNMDFAAALKLAQEKGYAEKDPTADIEGHDACRKICILSSLGFGSHIYPEQVDCEGISDITLADVEYADFFNCVIKLIGSSERLPDGSVSARVRPTLVSREHMLSGVNGVFNAIMVTGDETGDVLFYGKGAGKLPTASAVCADVIDCAKHLNARKYFSWESAKDNFVASYDEITRLYVYVSSDDFDTLSAAVESIFPNVSCIKNAAKKELAFLSEEASEKQIRELVKTLPAKSVKILHTLF